MSKGEDRIARILKANRIEFEREKSFDDLRGGRFRYDFYCPNFHGEEIIIEFNGRQHYQQVLRFQPTRADFLKTQEHDRRKMSYALANRIKIYCIPYWEEQNLNSLEDLCNKKYLVCSRWHNDEIWRKYARREKV